ncbi:YveK family protein [Acetilactobacillus jinshanensis]|uniref:Capsular polysaccharide biosynthesis protein CpsC n=2 Tax=Lactobacillaceae TaxID=33958 RepID=A0A4P6ZJ16_9LACO|nr:Wzz/FepE/Etk N-terminal domain-containing protein [Acetilactobacillus jinshanensis]QBP17636.1 chain-length determining protein [Acetilactobacillus jinshanensis]URL61821.1 chain-length determining protein [uncultured bacterium]
MNNNFDLSDVFQEVRKFLGILKNHIKTIILTTILTVAVFSIALFFVIKPQYQASTQMIVDQKVSKSIRENQIQALQQADSQLVNTYKSIITSPTVSSRVQKRLGNGKLVKSAQVSVDTQPNSQVFNISVKSSNPFVAAQVSNETAKVFKSRLKHFMGANTASVIAKAAPNPAPVFPKRSIGLLLGLVVGVMLGIALALFEEFGAKYITSMDYVTNNLELTNLGEVNDINLKKIRRNAQIIKKHSRHVDNGNQREDEQK